MGVSFLVRVVHWPAHTFLQTDAVSPVFILFAEARVTLGESELNYCRIEGSGILTSHIGAVEANAVRFRCHEGNCGF